MTISKITCGAFLLSLGLLTGCGEKFLEEAPADQITDVNFYQSQQDAIQATTAVYSELTKEGQYNLSMWAFDIMADISVTGGDDGNDGIEYKQLEAFNIPSTNTVINRLWGGSFIGLQRANLVLQKVPGIANMDPDIKKRCLGEAQFLRAKYYFDLVRVYGDVPLFTAPPASPEAVNIPRTAAAEVYKQIEQDLNDAIGNLPASYSGADLGRATKWAATGLLAKVYITEAAQGDASKKALAAQRAREVINNSGKALWANYGDNFKVANENGQESLFEVQFVNGRNEYDRNNVGSSMNEFFGPRGANQTPGSGYGFNIPEPDFVSGYETGDTRKAVTVWVPGDVYPDGGRQAPRATGSPFGYNCKKWFVGKVNTNIWDSGLNVPVLRLAEMYLILAEAVGPTTEGLEAINKVRRRAFGLPINTPSAARDLTSSTTDFTGAVLRERKYELAFEFDRWFDLKRYNGTQYGLIPVMTTQAAYLRSLNLGINRGIPTEKNLVLPIPQSELDANPGLKQNPGY
jgi:hypothetical protein